MRLSRADVLLLAKWIHPGLKGEAALPVAMATSDFLPYPTSCPHLPLSPRQEEKCGTLQACPQPGTGQAASLQPAATAGPKNPNEAWADCKRFGAQPCLVLLDLQWAPPFCSIQNWSG